jgi:hypothetical protein
MKVMTVFAFTVIPGMLALTGVTYSGDIMK